MASASSTAEVCRRCHERNPTDLSLFTLHCRSSEEHSRYDKVLVTEYCGTLVKIRPLPREFRPPRFFRICNNAGGTCRLYPNCTYAHSEAEKNIWNSLLSDEQNTPHERHRTEQPSSFVNSICLEASAKTQKPDIVKPQDKTISSPPVRGTAHHQPQSVPVRNAYLERQKHCPSKGDMILPVTLENYRQKYRALLYYEEEEHVEALRKKCDGQYKIEIIKKKDIPSSHRNMVKDYKLYAYIEGMCASQVEYALQASNRAFIARPDTPFIKCTVMLLSSNYNTGNDKLYIGFDDRNADDFLAKLNGLILTVKFEIKHTYFNDLNIIISQIADDVLKRILPNQEDFSEELDLCQMPKPAYPQFKLDSDQLCGLQTMLFSPPPAPVLITGPFGCGKTHLLAVATKCIIHKCKDKNIAGRVLICCYQQDSADIFMNNYLVKMIKDEQNPWDVEVIHVTSQHCQVKLRENRCIVNTLDFKESFKKYQTKQYLAVVAMYVDALRMSETVPKDYFTHILIDEGAQTREPETIAPLIMANKDTSIIIAGDSQQVGPKLAVLGDDPQQYGLGVSLFERLHNQYERFGGSALNYVVSLKCNYCCHPDLLELPSTLFYKSALVPQAVNECHPACSYPLKFICSSFNNDIPFNPENPYEALLILQEVNELLKCEGWDIEDVCIMAASLNQANCIRKGIYKTRDYECLRGISVRTSYQMQGQEYSLLLISTSESLESSGRPFDLLKSFCHPAIFNTAITRARCLVVAVGNPLLLMTSEATLDEPKWCWREFITRCLHNKSFVFPVHLKNKYFQVKDQLQKISRIREYNEVVALFQRQNTTKATKVEKGQTNSGVLISPPSSSSMLLSNEEYSNAWPKFDSNPKTACIQEVPWPQLCSSNKKHTILQVNTHLPSTQSSLDTTKKQSKKINSSAMQKEATCKPDYKISVMEKDNKDCIKKKKYHKNLRETQSQSNSVFTDRMSQTTPMNFVQRTDEKSEMDKINTTPETRNESATHYQSKQDLPYKRPKQKKTKKSITILRPKITLQDVIPTNFSLHEEAEKLIVEWPLINELESTTFRHEHRSLDEELLKVPLNRENYKIKFHQLLCQEEEEHDKILKKRCDGYYNVIIFESGLRPCKLKDYYEDEHVQFGSISGGNLNCDLIAYAKQASANIVLHFSCATVCADIVDSSSSWQRESEALLIAFTEEETYKLINQRLVKMSEIELENVYVSFTLKWFYFDRLHEALDKLSFKVLEKITPTCLEDFEDPYVSGNLIKLQHPLDEFMQLDQTQMKALTTIMNCDPCKAPVLVVGSFGTGKTRLLACAAYEILHHYPNSHVLICAHHQASADTFINSYFGKMCINKQVIRLIPQQSYIYDSKYAMYYLTTKQLTGDKIQKADLIVTTFSTSLNLLKYVHKGFFTHILLDEGAQSREPETVAPLCLANTYTKIVIAGDHKQVGPSLLVLGDKAIENGLSISLLERLQKTYTNERFLKFSSKHSASLITNFRCHHALLSLPSNLFYDSALISAAKSATQLHPKAKFPLHFICSSLADDVLEIVESKHELEATLLLMEALKYVSEWPTLEWGEKDLQKICIITATADQRYYIINELYKREYKQLAGIEVLKVYDIQGREYEAVFLSTAEPTTAEGRSKNPIKTPCSQYVFNTALTRAKSLVVCAGNPFLLMKIEEHMNNECSCWKDYIRRCVLSKTFHVPPKISAGIQNIQKSLECLQMEVFSTSDVKGNTEELVTKDCILKSYQQAIQEIPRYKYSKLQISDEQGDTIWDIVRVEIPVNQNTSNDAANEKTNKLVTCELSIINKRQAKAFPINTVKHSNPIVINGYNHRRGAFDGDIVDVHVFGTHPDNVNEEHGRVVFLREARHPTKYVCTADQYNIINFYPLDKSVPTIVNLPKISRKLLRYQDPDMHVDYITVFKESSLKCIHPKDDHLPQIKELIPHDMAQSLLFVVTVLGWAPEYRKPLGAVVEILPRTTNLFFTERLLSIVYEFETNNEINDIDITLQEPDRNFVAPHYDRAFTIDPPNSIDLDDAISLVPLQDEGKYKLAILITNVAKHIPKDHHFDKLARQRGTSIYGGNKVKHMLPVNLTTETFSLNYNTTRDVLAVTATVVVKEGKISDVLCNEPEKAQVTSQARLTYRSAQQILDDKPIEDEESCTHVREFNLKNGERCMHTTMNLLFQIAKHLREKRLKQTTFSGVSEAGDNDHKSLHSHLLVSELMIWANTNIANYLLENLKQMVLLCRQLPPLSENLAKFRETFQGILCYSLALKMYSQLEELDENNCLIITNSTVHYLKTAFENYDQGKILWALSNDHLYPQLARACSALRMISQRAEYISAEFEESSKQDDNSSSCNFAHYGLQVDAYTHFTSPIRRYFDILVQRLVIALLDSEDITYKQEELQKICTHLNMKAKMAKRYERSISNVLLAKECESGLKCVQAFVSQSFLTIKQLNYQLCIPSPDFNYVSYEDTRFQYSDLNINRYENEKEPKWHIILASLDNSLNDLLCDPRINNFTNNPLPIEETSGIYCCIEASVFSYLQASEKLKNDDQKQMKRVKYRASVINNTFEVSTSVWDLAHQYLKSPSQENITSLIQKLPTLPLPNNRSRQLLYPEFSKSPVVIYDITRSFQPGEVVNVWFGKSLKQPLPSPELQLMEIAPTFKVCVQHNQNPVLCFSDVQLQKASLEQYHSIDEYAQLWSKVLVAEAAYEGINTQVITMIKNARLEWPKKLVSVDNCIDDKHYKPDGELTLNIPSEKVNIFDFIKVKVGDLVCVRYDIKEEEHVTNYKKEGHNEETLVSVFHFVITKKNKLTMEGTRIVKAVQLSMKAMGSHCWISEKLRPYLDQCPYCEMQIIAMPISFNRVFNRLQSGLIKDAPDSIDESDNQKKCWSALAKKIAIGLRQHDNPSFTGVSTDSLNIYGDIFASRLWGNSLIPLNQTQMQAIDLALRHSFQLIQGPPGTGKSVVGAHLAYIFSKINACSDKCVLYCCPSNKAIDVVHKKLKYLNTISKPLRIIRLYGSTHERVDYPDPFDDLSIPSNRGNRKQDVDGCCLPGLKEDALHFKVRQENPKIERMRLEYKNLIENENIIPSLLERNRYKQAIKRAEKKLLQRQYDVILCTCNETCSGRLLKFAGDGRIAQCIVDECGMTNEPETIAAASLCNHVVLIGDHKQLQPIIKYHMARECGMGVSLFERYAELRPDLLIILDTQYRMHESICNPPSILFYENELQTDKTVKRRSSLSPTINQFWPSVYPIVVFDVIESYITSDKKFTGKFDIHSKSNCTEALKVLEVIQELRIKHNISYQSIAVLTPYAAQKDLIIHMIRDDLKLNKESRPKVTTIVESQGDEYDIVILTTVRSLPINDIKDPKLVQADRKWMTDNLGFLIDEHQVNVGITRAKHGLIIIGNTTLLKYDETWKQLLKIYDSYGCVKYQADPKSTMPACN